MDEQTNQLLDAALAEKVRHPFNSPNIPYTDRRPAPRRRCCLQELKEAHQVCFRSRLQAVKSCATDPGLHSDPLQYAPEQTGKPDPGDQEARRSLIKGHLRLRPCAPSGRPGPLRSIDVVPRGPRSRVVAPVSSWHTASDVRGRRHERKCVLCIRVGGGNGGVRILELTGVPAAIAGLNNQERERGIVDSYSILEQSGERYLSIYRA